VRPHWTERSIKDYLFRIATDFIAQLEKKMESEDISQDELAKRLKITKGRVSQVLNHPGNISLAVFAKYARALGMKMSIIAYDDHDPLNKKGPINSEIFEICWEECGRPHDFWAFQEIKEGNLVAANVEDGMSWNEIPLEKGKRIQEPVSAVDVTPPTYLYKGRVWNTGEDLALDLGQYTVIMATARPKC